MKILMILAIFLFNSSNGCLKMDLILLGDLSGSCQGKEGFIGDAFINIIEKLEIGEDNVKVGIVTFNSWVGLHTPLTESKTKALQAAMAIKTTKADYSTAIWIGLEEAMQQLYSEHARNVRKMIIIITDAQDDNPEQTRRTVQKLNALGITLVGVLIENNSTNEDFMKEICPYYIKTDYEQLSEEILKLDICL